MVSYNGAKPSPDAGRVAEKVCHTQPEPTRCKGSTDPGLVCYIVTYV